MEKLEDKYANDKNFVKSEIIAIIQLNLVFLHIAYLI